MKDTVSLFWELGAISRTEIIHKLGLLPKKEDRSLPEVKRSKIAFENAGKMGLVKRLRDEVIKTHKHYYPTKQN